MASDQYTTIRMAAHRRLDQSRDDLYEGGGRIIGHPAIKNDSGAIL
jgi:hypothetical protein